MLRDPTTSVEVTAYRWVPPMARGFVKDMRVRWALEEIDLPYRVRLVGGAGGEKSPEHLADQPFGQVPVYKETGLTLFESGAILIHLGHKDDRLLPRYYFTTEDGEVIRDDEGEDLNDVGAAKREAVRFMGDILSDHPDDFLVHQRWRMLVSNKAGGDLFTIEVSMEVGEGISNWGNPKSRTKPS